MEQWEYGGTAHRDPAPTGAGFPWPPAEDGSPLTAFGETWKSSTFDPARFFRGVPRHGGTGPALLYFLALAMMVAGVTLFWESLALFTIPLEDSGLAEETGLGSVSPMVRFLLAPIRLLVMLLLSATITHGLLRLFDGARHGFGTTLRVFCYAYSPALFGVVPVIGGVVGAVWMLVLVIIGLRDAHEADAWKPFLALLTLFVLLLGVLLLGGIWLLLAGVAILAP